MLVAFAFAQRTSASELSMTSRALAQLVAQLTPNQWVGGSSPSRPATSFLNRLHPPSRSFGFWSDQALRTRILGAAAVRHVVGATTA